MSVQAAAVEGSVTNIQCPLNMVLIIKFHSHFVTHQHNDVHYTVSASHAGFEKEPRSLWHLSAIAASHNIWQHKVPVDWLPLHPATHLHAVNRQLLKCAVTVILQLLVALKASLLLCHCIQHCASLMLMFLWLTVYLTCFYCSSLYLDPPYLILHIVHCIYFLLLSISSLLRPTR